jgi:hypothetical protein
VCFDAVENLISFVMLADPDGFADVLVLPYSTAAVIKFVCIAVGMLALLAALLTGLVTRISRRSAR